MIRRRRVAKGSLKPGHIVPLAEFTANRFERADELEANAAMQPNTAFVGQSDAGIGVAETSPRQFREQLQIECSANPLALVIRGRGRSRAGWERWYVPDALVRHRWDAVTDRRFLTRRTLWHWQGIARFVQVGIFAVERDSTTTKRIPASARIGPT